MIEGSLSLRRVFDTWCVNYCIFNHLNRGKWRTFRGFWPQTSRKIYYYWRRLKLYMLLFLVKRES